MSDPKPIFAPGPTMMGKVPTPAFFSAMSRVYAKNTGNSTRTIFAESLEAITAIRPITSGSVIHDNAAGPGTATSAMIEALPPSILPTIQIHITDSVPGMVSAARETFTALISSSSSTITVSEMDSQNLTFPDAYFTHSIYNFSVFAVPDPLLSLKEIHRTLQKGGVAAVLTWRRFGAGELMRAAQGLVRPDLPPIFIPHEEFMREGYLSHMMVEAGFEEGKVTTLSKRLAVTGENLEGLRQFVSGDFSESAKKGWTEEEVARWPEAIGRAMEAEVAAHGGLLFEAWVVLATK
ncbi:S-adenosyl-L-methionine-dependent methyltransferase [Coniochaeta sp. 2T2.1]|nr:S-adenosyl-L-methionine-dependent methyltransferase [Coniochaeta sp. 2T2.1]